ncbi:MAG: MFS transporter [Candidatus Micrarchaeia archaeon]
MEVDYSNESNISQLEKSKLSMEHLKIMLISGTSFFTDAYDLFIIGVVLIMLKSIYSPSPLMLGLLASSALFGAVIGPALFGYLGDKFGRKYIYWVTVSILAIAALGSALSQTLIILVIWRLFLGIGIGGDYPLSSTIVAEYSNKIDRGKLIASTFAMQGFGIIAGVALALLLLYMGVPNAIAWRLLLAIGAVPALLVIPARKKLKETIWYTKLIASKAKAQASASLRSIIKKRPGILIGTALSWFLLDVTYYGTGIFTPYLATLFGMKGILAPTLTTGVIFLIFAVPGYWVAVLLIDKEGRKPMQAIGFLAITVSFFLILLFGSYLIASLLPVFLIIYGLSFFFSNYGPNTTTYVYPAELYPTELRARGHGIAATFGKLGAAISTVLFPILIPIIGKFLLIGLLGFVSLLGFIVTIILLPETKQKSLFETSREYELHLISTDLSSEFISIIGHMQRASSTMSTMFSSDVIKTRREFFSSIKNEEHEADINVKNIMEYIALHEANPDTFSDLANLARRLDDIIDLEEAVASRVNIYSIKKSNNYLRDFSAIINKSVSNINLAINELIEFEAQKNIKGIGEMHRKIAKLENEADEILRMSLSNIMKSSNFKEIMKYKEIYELLELITDKCVDVMDVVSDITIRYLYSNK